MSSDGPTTDDPIHSSSTTARPLPHMTRYRLLLQLRQALVLVRNELGDQLASMRRSYEQLRLRQTLGDAPVRFV